MAILIFLECLFFHTIRRPKTTYMRIILSCNWARAGLAFSILGIPVSRGSGFLRADWGVKAMSSQQNGSGNHGLDVAGAPSPGLPAGTRTAPVDGNGIRYVR